MIYAFIVYSSTCMLPCTTLNELCFSNSNSLVRKSAFCTLFLFMECYMHYFKSWVLPCEHYYLKYPLPISVCLHVDLFLFNLMLCTLIGL